MKLSEIFNSREIAIIIWLILFILYYLSKHDIRKSIFDLLKSLFHYKIIISLVNMIFYISIIIVLLSKFGFWSMMFLKDSILWTFLTAFILLMNSVDVHKQKSLFLKTIIDSLKVIVIIQFIANSYTFSLISELILIPIIVLITMLEAYSSGKEEYKKLNQILFILLVIISASIIINSIYLIKIDLNKFRTYETLKKSVLPIILTISYLPFIYTVMLISNYESLFLRFKFGEKKSKQVIRYAKYKILLYCNINFKRQHKIMNMGLYNIMNIKNKEDVDTMIKLYKQQN